MAISPIKKGYSVILDTMGVPMNIKKPVACALFATLILSFTAAQSKNAVLVSLDWPPYIGSSIKDGNPAVPNFGYVSELVTAAFKEGGYELRTDFKPWERALHEATIGIYDGLFPEYFSSEREKDFVYSDAFPGGPVGLMRRSEKNIAFKTLRDLAPYTIGIVSGYINTDEFDAATWLKKDPAVDDETNIRKLMGKRLDLIFIDRYVGEYLIETKFPELKGKLVFIEPGLEVKPLYIVFSRKAKDYETKLKAFNTGLAKLKATGKIEAIMRAHGFEPSK